MKSVASSKTSNAQRHGVVATPLRGVIRGTITLSALLLALSADNLHAQVGNDNPAGASGIFNGQAGGCGYDPYTGNATRSITDIGVAGAVGEYPLALVRTANSRTPSTTEVFGWAGGWNHNYNWILEDSPASTSVQPKRYTVDLPDGRVETFRAVNWDTANYYRVRPGPDTPAQGTSSGVRERFIPLSNGVCYLVLADGGKVKFTGTQHTFQYNGATYYYYTYRARAVIDPYGLTTTLTYETTPNERVRLSKVQEPAGRYLQFSYATTNGPRISSVTASDGRTVNYYYQYGVWLNQVVYYNNAAWDARYQYTNSNIGGELPPLLWTCDDPMYSGPMKRIAYEYKPALPRNPDNSTPVYGQILRERYWDGVPGHETSGGIVSTLTVGSPNNNPVYRTETRGDGATRTFIYNGAGPGYLSWASDFTGRSASQTYDSYKYVNSVTDRNGNRTDYTLNPLTGNVTVVTYPLTQGDTPGQQTRPTLRYQYGWANCPDQNNRDANKPYYLYSITDEGGNATIFTRDASKRLYQITYSDGGSERFPSYNSFNQVLTHLMVTGGTETFTYDGRGLKQTYRNPDNPSGNPTARYRYDVLDRLTDVTDVLGSVVGDGNHSTSFSYNNRGQVLVATLPKDISNGNTRHTITNAYNPDGTLQSRTDELNHITRYTYDDYRRLKSVTTPVRGFGDNGTNTTSFYYGANPVDNANDYIFTDSNAAYVVLPSGKKLKTVYDDNRRKSSVTVGYQTGNDATTSYAYDAVGNLTTITNPRSQNTITSYDERNRPSSINDRGRVTTFTYDTAGRRKSIQRPNGQLMTNNTFDAMNRVTQQTATQTPDPTAVTKYSYYAPGEGQPVGLLKSFKDPRISATSYEYKYEYDTMGRNKKLTYPPDSLNVQRTEQWSYDTAGRLQTFTNRDNPAKVQTFTYDALNRMTHFQWSSGAAPAVDFGYDAASRLATINNVNANITRGYYNDNLLRSETEQILVSGGRTKTVTYTYNSDGNRDGLTTPDYTVGYGYTGRNQLLNVGAFATYTYDQSGYIGDLTMSVLGNGGGSVYAYDWLDRVAWVTHFFSGTSRVAQYDYDNSSGNRIWAKRYITPAGSPEDQKGEAFRYDLADQAIGVQLDVLNPDQVQSIPRSIIYDANGNRTSFVSDAYATNNLNQYSTRNGSSANYDTEGNLSLGFDGSAYQYDAQNRLTSASGMDFKYDGLNRQVSRTWNGTTTFSLWDGWDLVEEYQGATPTAAYVYGATGLIAGALNGQLYYFYQDGSGSTSHLADSNGALKEWYRYDLHGTPFFYGPNDVQQNPNQSAFGVRHLFTGQQWYSDIGLYDMRNRFYSPDIGRFLQPDPIGFRGDRTNLYRYCGNNPVTRWDPFGFQYPTSREGHDISESEEVIVTGTEVPTEIQVPLAPDPGDISRTGFLPGIMGGLFPSMGSDNPGFHRDYNPFPRLRENHQPSVQHPPPSVVPPQNPNLPDPSAALYPPGGTLTLQAANYWYMNGGGKPAVVDATRLDFSAVNPNGFDRKTGRQLYTFPKFQGITPSQDFLVYGTVRLQLTSDGTFGVLTDTYNFEMHPWTQQPGRNILTIIGNINANPNPFMHGTPYPIIFYNTVPVP